MRDSLINTLRERGGTSFGGVRLRKCIVTLQVAFSLILVVGAALFMRTLTGLLAKGPGFDTSRLISFTLAPVRNRAKLDCGGASASASSRSRSGGFTSRRSIVSI